MPGPPPTPNEILRKRGGHGRGWRLSGATPESPKLKRGTIPETPPKSLGTEGRALWRFVARLGVDWLAESDIPTLRQACETLDEVAEMKLTARECPDPSTQMMLLVRAQNARKQHIALLSMLGFSPADRTRYNLGEVAQEEDPLVEFRRGAAS